MSLASWLALGAPRHTGRDRGCSYRRGIQPTGVGCCGFWFQNRRMKWKKENNKDKFPSSKCEQEELEKQKLERAPEAADEGDAQKGDKK